MTKKSEGMNATESIPLSQLKNDSSANRSISNATKSHSKLEAHSTSSNFTLSNLSLSPPSESNSTEKVHKVPSQPNWKNQSVHESNATAINSTVVAKSSNISSSSELNNTRAITSGTTEGPTTAAGIVKKRRSKVELNQLIRDYH